MSTLASLRFSITSISPVGAVDDGVGESSPKNPVREEVLVVFSIL